MRSRKAMLSIIFLIILTSCTIAGEGIIGTWSTTNTYGSMTIKIVPWKGKFYGYLMKFENNQETISGTMDEEYIILTDLVYENNQFINGKMYIEPNSDNHCKVSLVLVNDEKIKVAYLCDDQVYEEFWTKTKFE